MKKHVGVAYAAAFLFMAAVALLRIADTYRVFNHTFDEVAHIAAGMQWLDTGRYTYDNAHPPMRAVFAVGPRMLAVHAFGDEDEWNEGRRILYDSGDYKSTLTAARVGALPFFLLTLAVVGVWAAKIAGPAAAIVAVFAYSMLPLALAHAGLATTDTLFTGTVTLALFSWALWLESPNRRRALVFGATAALAVLSKFSAILFLGVAVLLSIMILILHAKQAQRRPAVRQLAAGAAWGALIAFVVIWAGYRFSLAPLAEPQLHHASIDQLIGAHGMLHDAAYRLIELPVPAPEFIRGLRDLAVHNREGHRSYFMGEVSSHGHWAFFPVGILVKSPIAFLLLAAFGIAVLAARWKREPNPVAWLPVLGAVAILVACLPANINIGMRHVLPIFPLLAISIGAGVAKLWQHRRESPVGLAAAMMLLAWLTITSARTHPDYLAYFNECCSNEPQAWLVDSDLDWGQDLDRLAAILERNGAKHVSLAYFGSADLSRHGLPPATILQPGERARGWVAVSEFSMAMGTQVLRARRPPYDQLQWLNAYGPFERVGSSIRLYHVP